MKPRFTAAIRRLTKHRHIMPARSRQPCGFEAGNAGADHRDLFGFGDALGPPIGFVALAHARIVVALNFSARDDDVPAGVT